MGAGKEQSCVAVPPPQPWCTWGHAHMGGCRFMCMCSCACVHSLVLAHGCEGTWAHLCVRVCEQGGREALLRVYCQHLACVGTGAATAIPHGSAPALLRVRHSMS